MKNFLFILLVLNASVVLAQDPRLLASPIEAQDVPGELADKALKGQEQEKLQWWKVTLFGLALAPVEFFISTAAHEGAHAVAVMAQGGTVMGYHPWPHQHPGSPFRLGDTSWVPNLSESENARVFAAPMILDAAVLGTYGTMVASGNLPENPYAQVSMWVFATGHWVDLVNHMIPYNEFTDARKIEKFFEREHGLSLREAQLAVRGSQALVAAAGGYFLYKGLRKIFKEGSSVGIGGDKSKKKKKVKQRDLFLSPSGHDGPGISFGGRF